jgi:hypothetical protein
VATYATTAEVKAEFKSLDTSSSGAVITDTKIDTFRADAYALINARIGNKYSTPVSSSAACFGILRMLEIWLVKARIQRIIPVKTGSDAAKQGDSESDLEKKAESVLEQIVSGKMKMEGADLASSSDGVASFNVSEGTEHTVKKDEDQW